MTKAYVMIHLEVTNREEFISGFASKNPALVAEYGGKRLTGGPDAEVISSRTKLQKGRLTFMRYSSFRTKSQLSHGATAKDTRPYYPIGRTTRPTLTSQ